ncbi:MAG: Crp/Fnr family transcriptional regulator [Gammaproteobacteria bacterium]|nr:Crp/Fnr family transcriptional regulator [Gammaproteobacteria bacterium]
MQHPTALHHRLRALDYLDEDDFAALDDLLKHREDASPGDLIVMEEQDMNRTWVLLDGWAFRYKSFADGRRQILNYLLPGDIMGLYTVMLKRSDYGVEAITALSLAVFPSTELVDALAHRPRLLLALSWIAGQGERMLDEQIVRVGRRGAAERMAHLFVELHVRMRKLGVDREDAGLLPLTQALLSDTLGMSHVHANRCFRALTREHLVTLDAGRVVLLDPVRLAQRAGFDAGYLEETAVPRETRELLER